MFKLRLLILNQWGGVQAYTNVAITAAEVGVTLGAGKEMAVRDIWRRADTGEYPAALRPAYPILSHPMHCHTIPHHAVRLLCAG